MSTVGEQRVPTKCRWSTLPEKKRFAQANIVVRLLVVSTAVKTGQVCYGSRSTAEIVTHNSTMRPRAFRYPTNMTEGLWKCCVTSIERTGTALGVLLQLARAATRKTDGGQAVTPASAGPK